MTIENVFNQAKSGNLNPSAVDFHEYAMTIAIDACFQGTDIPLEVYSANRAAVEAGEVGKDAEKTVKFFELLGKLAFDSSDPELSSPQPYVFGNIDEFRTDLEALRDKSTILLDIDDGLNCVGLKPVADNSDEWQIVGTHQIVAAQAAGAPIDVQRLAEPDAISTEQVWEYLCSSNSPENETQTALIFPPEPHVAA